MARDKLTALQVKRAHDKGEAVLLADGACLYLRKQTSAGTTWTFRYRFRGRDRWMALGNYPDMELAEARKVARLKRTMVDAGRDPLLEKQTEIDAQFKAVLAKKARGKFSELAEDWYSTEIMGGRLTPGGATPVPRQIFTARVWRCWCVQGGLSLISKAPRIRGHCGVYRRAAPRPPRRCPFRWCPR